MSASANPIHALVDHLNSRGGVTIGDVAALLDMLIENKLAELACDLRRHGLAPHQIEASIEIQTELAHEWKTEVLCDVSRTFSSHG